ncbi:MAG: hypothetical protein HEEMFOPI_00264 [Holosporales bacterium]
MNKAVLSVWVSLSYFYSVVLFGAQQNEVGVDRIKPPSAYIYGYTGENNPSNVYLSFGYSLKAGKQHSTMVPDNREISWWAGEDGKIRPPDILGFAALGFAANEFRLKRSIPKNSERDISSDIRQAIIDQDRFRSAYPMKKNLLFMDFQILMINNVLNILHLMKTK